MPRGGDHCLLTTGKPVAMSTDSSSSTGKLATGQSMSRVFSVLRTVADNPGASLGNIASATGFARSTVQGIVNALLAEGALSRQDGRQGLFLGQEIFRLASKVETDGRVLFRPLIENLSRSLGENVNLATLRNRQVIVVDQVATYAEIQPISFVGGGVPLHCSATGKALLSRHSDEAVLSLLGDDLRVYTPKTKTDPQKVLDEVRANSSPPLLYDFEEMIDGVCALATTFPVLGNVEYAIAVSAQTARFHRKIDQIREAILAARRDAFAKFGPAK